MLALLICALGFVLWRAVRPSDSNSFSTAVGGHLEVTLPEGSVLQLNTATEVQTRITPATREIHVIRGEVFFKVAHDTRPLTVMTAYANVHTESWRAAGAVFDVRVRAPESIDVSVTKGNVLVAAAYRTIGAMLRQTPVAQLKASAGDAVHIRPEGLHVAQIGVAEINRKLSWIEGLLVFQGETLAQVADEFNRYNRKQLVIADPAIASRRIGGAFQATDPDSFVAGLEKWFGIHADEQSPTASGAGIVRLSRAQRQRR